MFFFVLLFGRHLHFSVYIFWGLRSACAPGFYEFLHSVNTCISKKSYMSYVEEISARLILELGFAFV